MALSGVCSSKVRPTGNSLLNSLGAIIDEVPSMPRPASLILSAIPAILISTLSCIFLYLMSACGWSLLCQCFGPDG